MKSKIFLMIVLLCMITSGLWSQQNGEHRYLSSKTLAIFYRYVKETSTSTEYLNTLTWEEIMEGVSNMEDLREFYWRNSNFILNLETEIYICEEPLTLDELVVFYEQYGLNNANVIADVAASGRNPADYGTIIGFWPAAYYNGKIPDRAWSYPVHNGIASVISIPSVKINNINDYYHEYHHSLGFMFYEAGYPDFPRTHFNDYQAAGNTGGEGIQWEFYGSTVKNTPVERWFEQNVWSWGDELTTADADNDGVPDYGQDGRGIDLAITEASLNTSTSSADTDGDYLSDLEEATAHFLKGSDPVNDIDSDDDGFIDGEDMYPLYASSIRIPGSSPLIDGVISPGEHHLTSSIDAMPKLAIDSYIDFDNENLYFSFKTYTTSPILIPASYWIYLDMNCDGILNGNDNYGIRFGRFEPSGAVDIGIFTVKGFDYYIGDDVNLDASRADIAYTYDTGDSTHNYEVAIPFSDLFGIGIHEGLRFNILAFYNGFGEKYNTLLGEINEDGNFVDFTKVVLSNVPVAYMEQDTDNVDFGTIDEGTQLQKTVEVKNWGETPLTLYSTYSTNSHFIPGQLPSFLRPGETAELSITFAPDQDGTYNGVIYIYCDAVNGMIQEVSCTGIAEAVSSGTPIAPNFTFDGIGEYTWEAETLGNYINSWNLNESNQDVLTVNGVDFTNDWASAAQLPPKINGKYYVYYKSSNLYGHFEAKY